jgi:hypothetical protein
MISVRAELVRAARHFMASGEEAELRPDLAGVRFEPSAAGGLTVIAMCETAMIVLHDRDGRCAKPVTLRIHQSLFDAGRRAQREAGQSSADAVLTVEGATARLSRVSMPVVQTIDRPFPPWRNLLRRADGPPPPVSARDLDRLANAARILEGMSGADEAGVPMHGVKGEHACLARFDAWPSGFAVLSSVGDGLSSAEASLIWALSGDGEMRAAS